MQLPSDPLYKQCCAVLRGEQDIPASERQFCDWLSAEFCIATPVSAVSDPTPDGRNRLHVVLRTRADAEGFYTETEEFYGRDEEKQDAVLRKARACGLLKSTDGWFVAWSAFEPVAIHEALSRVSDRTRKQVLRDFSAAGLSLVEPLFAGTIMMFKTEAQRLAAENNGVQVQIADRWRAEVLPFDEFGVLATSDLEIRFDSKEVFRRDYDGSWFRYTR